MYSIAKGVRFAWNGCNNCTATAKTIKFKLALVTMHVFQQFRRLFTTICYYS